MNEAITPESLHRGAKYFMDTGRAASASAAMDLLAQFGLTVLVGPEVASSRDHQVALLTLVNCARRTLLGGIRVVGLPTAPLLVPLASAASIGEAVMSLGGSLGEHIAPPWPVAVIGTARAPLHSALGWQLTWDGWRGGVTPLADARRLPERDSAGLAPALAAAACASEAFQLHAGIHPMAGRRTSGLSLWQPGGVWLADDATEPPIAYLPSRLWLIGLGNLGQAYLWLLNCLPYQDRNSVQLVLQDCDRIAASNDSTSLLVSKSQVKEWKTRSLSAWLEARDFRTAIVERRFGLATRRVAEEPGVALCGVDNGLARAALEEAGFDLVVEAGLGAGPAAFRSFSMHTFPGSRRAATIWSSARETASAAHDDSVQLPAYATDRHPELDACGLAQLASRTVGVPSVGLTAASLVIAELLRRLHGGQGLELISGSVAALEDVETVAGESAIYSFGHTQARAGDPSARRSAL